MKPGNVLFRWPFTGLDTQGYHPGHRGQVAKSIYIISKIAILTFAAMALFNSCPTSALASVTNWSFIGLPTLSLASFTFGSAVKREPGAFFFEFMVRNVCLAIGVGSLLGMLTQPQAAIAMIGTVFAECLFGECFEKDSVEIFEDSKKMPILPLRVVNIFIGLGKDLTFTAKTLLSSLAHKENYVDTIIDTGLSGLCVLIHGLNGRPAIFDDYHDAFQSKTEKITIFQPHVEEKGNCGLTKAGDKIADETNTWAQRNIGRPIVLIGVSNGARIAAHIAALLSENKLPNPIQVHCIAGPFKGTKMVNQPDLPKSLSAFWGFGFKKRYCEQVYEELSWESECSEQLIKRMRSVQEAIFHFYASSADTQIVPFTSSLPDVPNCQRFMTMTEGHQSIVRAVKECVIESSLNFFRQHHGDDVDQL